MPHSVDVPRPPRRVSTFRAVGRICLFTIALLVPFFFLPITQDPIGINKMALAGFLVLAALICFLGCVFEERKIDLPRSWFAFVLLIFIAVQGVSTFFSVAPIESFSGYLSRPDSFAGMILYGLLFFLSFFFFRREDAPRIGKYVGIGLLASSAIGFLQLFGVFLFPWQFARTAAFNPVGSVIQWGILMIAGVAMLAGAHLRDLQPWQKRFFLVFAIAAGAALFLMNYQFLWLAVAIFTIALAALRFNPQEQFHYAFAVIVIALFFALVGPRLPTLVSVPQDARVSIGATGAAIESALSGWRFLVGTGPATFSLDFSSFAPPFMNQGYDFILTLLATTGLLGFLSLLVLLGIVAEWFIQIQHFETDQAMIVSAVTFLFVALIFYPAFFVELAVLFILLGLLLAGGPRHEIVFSRFSRPVSFGISVLIMVCAAGTLSIAYSAGEQYAAAVLRAGSSISFGRKRGPGVDRDRPGNQS